jgi:hypothetical protein
MSSMPRWRTVGTSSAVFGATPEPAARDATVVFTTCSPPVCDAPSAGTLGAAVVLPNSTAEKYSMIEPGVTRPGAPFALGADGSPPSERLHD